MLYFKATAGPLPASGGIIIKGMVCEEKIRLIESYAAATSTVYIAVTNLRLKTGLKFREALATSEKARAACVKARRALRDHTHRHGC